MYGTKQTSSSVPPNTDLPSHLKCEISRSNPWGSTYCRLRSSALGSQATVVWHPGSERPVYLTLPAQRSCLLAMLNILVQKQPLHLWYKRVQQLQVTNYYEARRHG